MFSESDLPLNRPEVFLAIDEDKTTVRSYKADLYTFKFCSLLEITVQFRTALYSKSTFMSRSSFQTTLLTTASLSKEGEQRGFDFN
jgi:hypothetical protein